MPAFPQFIGGSYEAEAWSADVEDTVNWFQETLESERATQKKVLLPTPGVDLLSTAVKGPGRAHFVQAAREFAVIGDTFYEVGSLGALTSRGTVALDENPATICSNGDGGNQLFITSGRSAYVFALDTNTFTEVTALYGMATMGAYLDGRFLCFDAATSTFFCSSIYDGLTWNTTLDYAQRTLAGDPWKAMIVVGRLIWLFGEVTYELWHDTGDTFPYAPYASNTAPYGIVAPWSAQAVGDDVIWLGVAGGGLTTVLRASSLSPQDVASLPLKNYLQAASNPEVAVGDVHSWKGHTFYNLHVESGPSWSFDTNERSWHKRGTWDPEAGVYKAWRPRFHAAWSGQHRFLDGGGGSIWALSESSLDVDGLNIRRLRRAPAVSSDNRRVFFKSFELLLDRGLGVVGATPPADDPQVMLRLSNDGGKTWGAELWRSAGKSGEYGKRVRWNRLGQARQRVHEVVVSDAIPWRLSGAVIDAEAGGS